QRIPGLRRLTALSPSPDPFGRMRGTMTEADNAASSLAQHARLFDAGAHVVAAAFVDGAPTLALADGIVLIGDPQEQKRVVVYPDPAMLTATADGQTRLP